jgi:hypothetical protein
MPTIDQLAPASATADNDLVMISQNGVSRKITRGLLIAGLQPQVAMAPGTLLGNAGSASAAPSPITLGANLTLRSGTLSASAAPYAITSLPSGSVPAPSDLVGVGQAGADAAVTYSQFFSGLAHITNVDVSGLLVTPSGASSSSTLAALAASTARTTGATMTGPLLLSTDPLRPLEAATKQYVDGAGAAALPKAGGTLTGPLMLAADPVQPLQAATKLYVDEQAAALLPVAGGTLTGPLTLAGDPPGTLDAATRRYVDAGDANATAALAAETAARTTAVASVQTLVTAAQSAASSAQTSAAAAQASSGSAAASASAAQTMAASAATTAFAAQSLASSALPASGGSVTGNLSLSGSYVYAGTNDFAAVRLQGRPTDGKAMLYVNRVGSAGTDPSLFASYYYVNDAGGSGTPRLVNNIQANVASTPVSGIWLSHFGITSSAVGGNQGLNGHLAVDMQSVRDAATPIGNTIVQNSLSAAAHILSVADLTNFGQAPISSGTNAGKLTSLVNAMPLTTVSTVAASAGSTNPVLQLASTTGILPGMFCWGQNVSAYVVSVTTNSVTLSTTLAGNVASGTPINFGWTLLVKIGSHFYHLTSVSGSSGNGTMTFAEAIRVADGAAGNLVTAAQGGAPLWAFVAEIQDHTNLPSSAGGFAQIGELDLAGNGDDDGPTALVYNPAAGANLPQGGRCFLSFVGSKSIATGPDFVISSGLVFTTGIGASINSVIVPNVTYNASVLDLREAAASSGNANAIWMADRQRLALSTDGTASISYDPVANAIKMTGQLQLASVFMLPSYRVAALPASPLPGSKAYASDGRKVGEAVAAGTGVEVFADSLGRWISVLSGSPILA